MEANLYHMLSNIFTTWTKCMIKTCQDVISVERKVLWLRDAPQRRQREGPGSSTCRFLALIDR